MNGDRRSASDPRAALRVDLGRLFGRGLSFPFRIGPDGRTVWSEGPDNVRESIRVILLTEPRERLLRPDFGAGLRRHLFDPNVASTHRLIESAVNRSLERWEPRIQIESVTAEADPEDSASAVVTVRYKLVADRTRDQVRLSVRLSD